MANANVVNVFYGGAGRNKIPAQTLATTTETEFQLGNDTSASQIAVLNMPTQSLLLGSQTAQDQTVNPALLNAGFNRVGFNNDSNPPFNAQVFDSCKPFYIRLAGTYANLTGLSSVSILFKLYLGASKAGTAICATSAVANTSAVAAPAGFLLEAQLKWDSLSTAVRGQFWYDVSGTTPVYQTWATLTSSAGTAAAVANLQFCASATWGAVNGGTVNVSEFSIHQG